MKINPVLAKLELQKQNRKWKEKFKKKIAKGDFVSIIYYDLEKEQIKLQQFTGICTKFRSRGLNTKIDVRNIVSKVTIEQQFFFYSLAVVDVAILRKKQ